MAALVQIIWSLSIPLFLQRELAQPLQQLAPEAVFAADPARSGYLLWWRPLRVQLDQGIVRELKARINTLSQADAERVNLHAHLGHLHDSAYLFPVLACDGRRGLSILRQMLREYSGGARLDDRWLLIVATLGRMPLPESESILSAELVRLSVEYDDTGAAGFLAVERYLPVVDALLACKAGQGNLQVEDIEQLSQKLESREGLPWVLAFEWASALMNNEAFYRLLEDALNGSDDNDLTSKIDHQPGSRRVRGIGTFLTSSRASWPIAEELLIRSVERRPALEDFLIGQYLLTLVFEAEAGKGGYHVDEELVDRLADRDLTQYRGVAYRCWLLHQCKPSIEIARWNSFLLRHAAHLNPADRDSAQYWLDRIWERVRDGSAQPSLFGRPQPSIPHDRPGIYMHGFSKGGGSVRNSVPKRE